MNPLLLKFLKHAGFVVLGAVAMSLTSMLAGDPAILAFLVAHPAYSAIVPVVSGLLGMAAKYFQDKAAADLIKR